MVVDLDDFELHCPQCNEEAFEGELPYIEEEE
jgi:hypothetical protein